MGHLHRGFQTDKSYDKSIPGQASSNSLTVPNQLHISDGATPYTRNAFDTSGGSAGVPPTHTYSGTEHFTSMDYLRRHYLGTHRDCYIDCKTGKFKPLQVQSTDLVLQETQCSLDGGSTWNRRAIKSVGPAHLRLASWALSHIPDFEAPLRTWEWRSWNWFFKYLVSLVPLLLVSPFISLARDCDPNNTCYDQFPYAHFTCAKSYRNSVEDNLTPLEQDMPARSASPERSHRPFSNQGNSGVLGELRAKPLNARDPRAKATHEIREEGIIKRILNPRLIYSLNRDCTVDLEAENLACPKYVFVAYTDAHFAGPQGKINLHSIATQAARDAGCTWYWSSAKCVNSKNLNAQDVFNIADVLRGAEYLAVALPENQGWAKNKDWTMQYLLREWSERIWTLPELLVSPGKMVHVYFPDSIGSERYCKEEKNKLDFLRGCLNDSQTSRQLIEHYDGSLVLSSPELTSIALQCFSSRKTKSQYMAGDYSYALMGLLRRRPEADATDSPFLAFARLSLANHNDQLLERLICMLYKSPSDPWHSINDSYGAMMWDIIPTINIAGIGVYRREYPKVTVPPSIQHHEIGPDDVVIVDGCRAATIHWDRFRQVAQMRNASWRRRAARLLLRFTIVVLVAGIACANNQDKSTKSTGAVLLLYSILVTFMFPVLVIKLYMGKLWYRQPWLFGFEGYSDIWQIERWIFGASFNRLQWSHAGSPLSQYTVDGRGIIKTLDPCTLGDTWAKVQRAAGSKPNELKIFTLVDTVSMTVTLFEAKRPPVALLLCGVEGGMQRAIGCSFDWTTGTLYKETVLRVPTELVSRMYRIPRVKLGIRRQDMDVVKNSGYARREAPSANSNV